MSELLNHPAVVSAISVVFTLLVMGVFWIFKKRKLDFDFLLPTVTTIIEAIFGNAGATNPGLAVRDEVGKRLSQEDLAILSKRLATDDPIQTVYDTITNPARASGEKDGSSWIRQVASGLGASAISGLAKGLAKKMF